MRNHVTGYLPGNQVYGALATTTVDFDHPSDVTVVGAFQQLISQSEARWEQEMWSTLAEMSVMSGSCKIEHPESFFDNLSQYDVKMGTTHILRMV